MHLCEQGNSDRKLFKHLTKTHSCPLQVDPIERFGSRQKLLSLDLDIPAELLQNSGPPDNSTHDLTRTEVVGHLKLVQYQSAQVRLRRASQAFAS